MEVNEHKINKAITAQQVRLIGKDGEAIGIVGLKEALAQAAAVDLDLVEIVPQAVPPVCKIVEYGKFRYELHKKKIDAQKKQKKIEIKEVKFTPSIGEHDYQVKLSNIRRFIADGNKVKVTLRFRGRELSHQNIGVNLLNRLINDVKEYAKNESSPQLEGRQMMITLSPLSTK